MLGCHACLIQAKKKKAVEPDLKITPRSEELRFGEGKLQDKLATENSGCMSIAVVQCKQLWTKWTHGKFDSKHFRAGSEH